MKARVVSGPINARGDRVVQVTHPCPTSPDRTHVAAVVGRGVPEGQPVGDNEVLLQPTHEEQDVETIGELKRRGPAKVVSAAYRENYDAIFGKQPRGEA